MKTNCIVAQSGGPTAAINASLAGVVKEAVSSGEFDTVYGSQNGITGILEDSILNLTSLVKENPDNLFTLQKSPAMYLGSCRYKLPSYEENEEVYKKIFEKFEEYHISAFFYIGGNDSMDTVSKLSAYGEKINSPVRILGIPKTIDNDLCITDHTPGFGSAAKYIAATMLEIAHDTYIYNIKSVTIVEIMGRDAGWLTAASALARNSYSKAPHLIYLPETPFSTEEFLSDLEKLLKTQNDVIVAVSEGIRDKDNKYISASDEKLDNFGHAQLNGAGKTLEYLVSEKLGVKVRSIELSILQRCASHIASKTDLEEAFASGEYAVKLALKGETASMVAMKREEPYAISYHAAPIGDIANEIKSVPREWITPAGNDVTPEMVSYLLPLIQGEVDTAYENGLPVYLPVGHLIH